jgi:hypothetical protein
MPKRASVVIEAPGKHAAPRDFEARPVVALAILGWIVVRSATRLLVFSPLVPTGPNDPSDCLPRKPEALCRPVQFELELRVANAGDTIRRAVFG